MVVMKHGSKSPFTDMALKTVVYSSQILYSL